MQTASRQPSHHHGFLASRLMSSLISDSQTPGPLPLPAELLSRERGLEAVQSPDSPCCVQRGCFCGFCCGSLPGAGILHIECILHIACILHIVYCILSAALSTASPFRIWNSSTGILSLPGASVRNSTPDTGHEEGGSAYAKAGSSLRGPPGNSRASTPKTRVCLLSALCFHLHL